MIVVIQRYIKKLRSSHDENKINTFVITLHPFFLLIFCKDRSVPFALADCYSLPLFFFLFLTTARKVSSLGEVEDLFFLQKLLSTRILWQMGFLVKEVFFYWSKGSSMRKIFFSSCMIYGTMNGFKTSLMRLSKIHVPFIKIHSYFIQLIF